MQGIGMLRTKNPKKANVPNSNNIRTQSNIISSRGDSENTDPTAAFINQNNPSSSTSGGSAPAPEDGDSTPISSAYDPLGTDTVPANSNYDFPVEEASSTNSGSNSKSSPSTRKKIKGYMKVAGKRALGQVISSGMNLASGIYTTATKLPLAATLGTLGIAAGLASDNDANIAKYGATAAGIGYALSGSKKINMSELKEDSEREIYGKDYEEHENQQSDKAFMKDIESINYYKSKYGSEQYKQKMQAALKYRANGITDNRLISKSMAAPGNWGNEYSEQRIALAQLSAKVSNSKDIDSLGKRLRLKGVTDAKADEVTDAIRHIKGLV